MLKKCFTMLLGFGLLSACYQIPLQSEMSSSDQNPLYYKMFRTSLIKQLSLKSEQGFKGASGMIVNQQVSVSKSLSKLALRQNFQIQEESLQLKIPQSIVFKH